MDKTKIGVLAGLAVLVGFYSFARMQQDASNQPPHPEPEAAATAAPASADLVGGVKELKIEEVKQGTGQPIKAGDVIDVDYTGTLLNGEVFDSSVGRQPFTLKLGEGMVIAGWDQGLVGMKPGGKRKLTIPAKLAYGEAGSPPKIPPGATLVFDVTLVGVRDSSKPGSPPA